MEIRISGARHFGEAELESLHDWLRAEGDPALQSRIARQPPHDGELGALGEAMVVAVGSGGAISTLALSLKSWLSQPRKSDIRIRVEGTDGRIVEVVGGHVNAEQLEAIVRRVLGDETPGA